MRFATLALVALTMGASGCGVLDPKPDSSRYFLLRPLAEAGSGPALDDLVLGVGPMSVPDYLDRTEMIELVGPYEVRYSAQDRWIEPLGAQLRRVLAENLMTLLRPDRVVEYPWYQAERVGLQVEVTFAPIRLDDDGSWTGDAYWLVRDGESHEERDRGAFTIRLGSAPLDGNGVAARFSEEVRRMSGEIAVAVRRHHGMRP